MDARHQIPACTLALAALVAPAACTSVGHPTANPRESTKTFAALVDREWEWRVRDNPLLATSIGDHRYDDRLSDESLDAYARRAAETGGFLDDLAGIDRNLLSESDRVNYDMLKGQLEERRDAIRFGEQLIPLNADSGFHTGFALLPQQMVFATTTDYDKYVARLGAFPRYMNQNIALLREGLRTGMTIPKVALAGIETSITPLVQLDPTKSALWEPFTRLPSDGTHIFRHLARAGDCTANGSGVRLASTRIRTATSVG